MNKEVVVTDGCSGKVTDSCGYDEAVELAGHGRYNYTLLGVCSIIVVAVAIDMFGYSVVVAASSCDLGVGLKETGLLASAPFAGLLFAFPWGFYADTRGRRKALLISTSFGFLFAALSSLSMNWQFMFASKLFGCGFSTASFTLVITLLGECTGSSHRNVYLFMLNSVNLSSEIISFSLAYLILPLSFQLEVPWLGITYRPWRLYTFIMALPLGIGALLMLFMHESPKFLANKGELDKALEVLKKIYAANGGKREDYPVKHIITEELTTEKNTFWKTLREQTVPIFKPPLLLRTVQLFYLMALCCSINNVFFMWFPTMVNIFFNTLSDVWTNDQTFCERVFSNKTSNYTETVICNDEISHNTIYSGIFYGFFFCVVTAIVAQGASRRRMLLIGILIVSGVSCILVELKHPVANIIFFILMQSTAIGIGNVCSYFVDVYPTSYRGLATSLGMMTARLVSFAGVNIIGNVITDYCTPTFYISAAFVFSGVIVCFFLPADRKTNE
ncbi:synaptic vesicle glycoprotein 2B [Bombyx mori]|uniref:Major facilitator superfamily (MFS) profile domain-containing protein n=2 Tax=Bombyx mori TaxID=7091 RepID=A0A8R2C5L7_BOMMO|nr:synaptic vesicle glycoprotein 2B isoform X1 [Bombyx mori]